MSFLKKNIRIYRRKEDGSATVEIVFLFPLFMSIFLMGFESGFYMVRNVMVERAVDISVRDIRLGNGNVPEYADIIQRICDAAVVLPDCENTVHIHMEEVAISPGAIAALDDAARCLNWYSDEPQYDDSEYEVGQANTMMLVQVCATVSPFFPTTGLGLKLQNSELSGDMAIVATTAFVNEPGTRAMAPYTPPIGGGGTGGGTGGGGSGDGTVDSSL